MRVRIVTDSTALVPPEFIARHLIEIVPLTLTWDGRDYRDGIDITYAEFAARAQSGSTPKTAAPSPGEYMVAFERSLGEADALLVIAPPAELSTTFSNATLAAQAIDPVHISVLDSRAAAAGQGLVVIEAARAADAGADLDGVRDLAATIGPRVKVTATLERLDYLRRSGRVPAVAAFATDALNLHPVFRFVNGTPSIVGASLGPGRAADRIMADFARPGRDGPNGGRAHVIVMHSSRLQEAERLHDRVLAEAPGAEAFVVEVTAAMAAHLGPGFLGLAWWREPAQAAGG